jgi:hypothetical protein
MVMKLTLVFALVAVGFACPCTDQVDVEAFNPSQILDFARGFIYGAQANECGYTYCYYNTTYFVTQV